MSGFGDGFVFKEKKRPTGKIPAERLSLTQKKTTRGKNSHSRRNKYLHC